MQNLRTQSPPRFTSAHAAADDSFAERLPRLPSDASLTTLAASPEPSKQKSTGRPEEVPPRATFSRELKSSPESLRHVAPLERDPRPIMPRALLARTPSKLATPEMRAERSAAARASLTAAYGAERASRVLDVRLPEADVDLIKLFERLFASFEPAFVSPRKAVAYMSLIGELLPRDPSMKIGGFDTARRTKLLPADHEAMAAWEARGEEARAQHTMFREPKPSLSSERVLDAYEAFVADTLEPRVVERSPLPLPTWPSKLVKPAGRQALEARLGAHSTWESFFATEPATDWLFAGEPPAPSLRSDISPRARELTERSGGSAEAQEFFATSALAFAKPGLFLPHAAELLQLYAHQRDHELDKMAPRVKGRKEGAGAYKIRQRKERHLAAPSKLLTAAFGREYDRG